VRVLNSPTTKAFSLYQSPPPDFSYVTFQAYNPSMSDSNPLAGIVPRRVHPRIDGETAVTEHIEKIEGEVALDSYVKAQTSAPQVVKRINELENSLQRVANAALALTDIQRHPELRAAAEEAKLVLKNRLEVDDTKHRFHSELGVIKDDSTTVKD
jgi:Zn-dependent oligopeptidase